MSSKGGEKRKSWINQIKPGKKSLQSLIDQYTKQNELLEKMKAKVKNGN